MGENKPNILLVVLDAVRADHVSCYGHTRDTTPFIDQLAESGIRFRNAFSASNWTGTSHASIFTGNPPSLSGVYGENQRLPDEQTLPEKLQESGYRTFGASAGAHIRSERGYSRGFDQYEETFRIRPSFELFKNSLQDRKQLEQVLYSLLKGDDNKSRYKINALKEWITEDDQPFFGFVNLKTAHNPYNPPRPYKSKFDSGLRRPRFEFIEQLFNSSGFGRQEHLDRDIRPLRNISEKFPVMAGEYSPDEEEWEIIKSWYDGAIRYMDDLLQTLVDDLRDRGELRNTNIIITADHGELFGEWGLTKHNFSLHERLLHVPLIIYTGQDSPKIVSDPVSLTDLHPTILELAGISSDSYGDILPPADKSSITGHKFAEVGSKPIDAIERHHANYEHDQPKFDGPIQSVRDDRYKLTVYSNGERELINWRNSTGDISDQKPDVVSELQEKIDSELGVMDGNALDETIEDTDLEQQLIDLGYM